LDHVGYQTLCLNESEGKIVFVMTKDTVEVFVAIVLEIYSISKYLERTLQKREPEVVRVNVGQCCTES